VQAPLQGVYHPRDPKSSDFYACVEDNFEELERVWDHKYQKQHGFWRPVIHDVIYNYLTLSSPEQDSEFRRQCRANWARLIKKIFQVDPLECPRCHGPMRIISFIEDPAVIKKILQHLKLWEVPKRSPPAKPPPRDFVYDSNFFDGLTN